MHRSRVDLLKRAFVHGRSVASVLPFRPGELAETDAAADLFVTEGPVDVLPVPERPWSSPRPGLARCDLAVGRIRVEDGARITVDTEDWPALRPWVVGTAFALAAQQRGALVLHASTVVMDGVAVAFAAPTGVGKSTLVAALIADGARLLAEDVTAIDTRAWPGPRRLRLNPDAAAAIGLDGLALEPETAGDPSPKLGWAPPAVDGPVPLGAVVVLAAAAADAPPTLRPTPPHLAWGALVTNSYTLRLMHASERIRHLQACADTAGKVPVLDVEIPRSLTRIREIAAWLRADLAARISAAGLVARNDRG